VDEVDDEDEIIVIPFDFSNSIWAPRLVGRCRLPASTPVLKAPMASASETIISETAFIVCFQFQLVPLHPGGG
jgi:hypothetical protein